MSSRLNEVIDSNLRLFQTEPVIFWHNTWWSRGAFQELVDECEIGLRESGFKAGQRLALLLPNSPVFLAESIAVWRLGGTVVPIDPKGGYVSLVRQLNHADVFGAITSRGSEGMVPLISEEGIPCVVSELDAPPPNIAGRSCEIEDENIAIIFYTSGITSAPKAVPLTHENVLANIDGCVEHMGVLEYDDVFLNALPNYNALGFVSAALLPLVKNVRQTIISSFMPPESTMDAMRKSSVSVILAVPTMLALLFGAASRGFRSPTSLRYIISGGDRLPPGFHTRSQELLGAPIFEGYGLTEASSVVSINTNNGREKTDSVGTLMSSLEGEIRNDAGEVLSVGSEGRLWLRGNSVASNYYRAPEITKERFVDGWFNTCDIARFDEEGYLYLVSRVSEVIFVGGFKVYAQEVEKVLREHPAVAEAAVIGIPRSISGEIVKAFVVLKKGEKATARDLTDYCKKKMAYYKVPRMIEFRAEMPRSNIGEILKRQLERE